MMEVIAGLIALAVVVLVLLAVFTFVARCWLQAWASGLPISMFNIIGMRFRRIPVRTVLGFLIMARQAGVDIRCRQMESAYLQGVDLEKVTLAMIHARRQNKDIMFSELVEADLEARLAEKLKKQ